MTSSFPTALDVLSNPAGTDPLASAGGIKHSIQHTNVNDIIEAMQAKLGIGASTPVVNRVLAGTGTGTSGFRQITAADIADNTITSGQIADNTITATQIGFDTINQFNIAPGAVGLSELQSGADGILNAAQSAAAFSATGAGVWAYDSAGAFIPISMAKAGVITVIAVGAFNMSAAGTYGRFGIMQWGSPGPVGAALHHFTNANAPYILVAMNSFTVSAGHSAYYTMAIQCNGSGHTMNWHADGARILLVFQHYQ